jgi:hypothetical protein
MHILFLLVIIPFSLLLASLGTAALVLVFTAIVEFPVVLAGLLATGWFAYYNIGRFAKRQGIPCQQM